MGKSSSSRKKDRSKTSSSQRRKRKNSRKLKSKKLRHRYNSPSYSDTDLESSTSVSSSSSEGNKKVGRSRSGRRKDARASKRRPQKRSRNRQSRDYSPHLRKRKHSKRDDDSEVKTTYKKKRKRDVSSSATSSDSLSCSSCRDGTTSSNESDIDRNRGRSAKRKRNLRKTERSRYRSKSHSPCSLCSKDSDYEIEIEDDSFVQNNRRRLRSVIVVVGEQHKLKEFNGNQQQEEVTYHPDDDQPSFRNTDGNDGANKRELDRVASKEASDVENEKEVFVPDVRNVVNVKDHEIQNKGSYDNQGEVTIDYALNERKNDCSGNNDSGNCIDLESILRQRALENLRRFKAVPQKIVVTPANWKVDYANDVKQLYSPASKSVHVKNCRDDAEVNGVEFSGLDGGSVVNSFMIEENGAKSTVAIDLAVENTQDSIHSSQNLGKIFDGGYGSNKLKQDCSSLDQEVLNDNTGQKAEAVICSSTNRSNLVIAASRPRPQQTVDSHIKQASASQESIQEKPSISDMNVDETAQKLTKMTNNDDQNTGNRFGSSALKSSSSLKSISAENNINKSGHASEEGSQFEQKTMSVMRGGEMVQVNYKVYIPKRASALTRRQLKR